MKMFYNYNPLFGRKKIKFVLEYTADFKRKIKEKIIEFDDNHITFNNIEKENEDFLTDHLKINDDLTENLELYMNVSVHGNNTNNEDNINHTTHYNSDEEKEDYEEEKEEDETKEEDDDEEKEEECDEEWGLKEEDYDY